MLLVFFLLSFLFAKELCLDFNIDTEDSYVNKRIAQYVERFALESGFELSCSEKSLNLSVSASFSERSVAISPKQRVSTYLFSLSIRIGSESFSTSVPYSLPSGALGELPRRKALEEAIQRLKLPIIKYFTELYAGKREP
ncbi:hypothetical protein JCM9492_14320 [Aquifex pyrophilus]